MKRTQKLTYLSMLFALEVVLLLTPLGYIPLGPIRATTLHIPVILAGVLLGYRGGMAMGLFFGLISLVYNTFAPLPTSFVFSPFLNEGNLIGIFGALFTSIVPRVSLGFMSAFLYNMTNKKLHDKLSIILTSLVSTVFHTVFVLGSIYVFFGPAYAEVRSVSYELLITVLLGVVTTNGIVEAILASIVVTIIMQVFQTMKKGKKG